jgi:hypothetical protein
VRIAGTDIVYNAPIVATGNGRFTDVSRHRSTHDRLFRINTRRRTVDMNFIRAFSHGKDIMYLSFESSSALTAVTDRSTFVPGLGLSPAPDRSRDPLSARSAIFAFTNGQRGRMSPPAQGQDHVIADGLNATPLHPGNQNCSRRCEPAATRTTCSTGSRPWPIRANERCTARCGTFPSRCGARTPSGKDLTSRRLTPTASGNSPP